MAQRSERRSAALIATAVTLPLIVIAALLIDRAAGGDPSPSSSPGVLAPLTVSAPPVTDDKTVATCATVISALPLRLAGQDVRRTVSTPASPSVVAWGDPAIVLRCGVDRPAELAPGSSTVFVTGGTDHPYYDVQSSDGANVWTTVDLAVYLEITVPARYGSGPVTVLSKAIAPVLPAVCEAGQNPTGGTDQAKLCTRRP